MSSLLYSSYAYDGDNSSSVHAHDKREAPASQQIVLSRRFRFGNVSIAMSADEARWYAAKLLEAAEKARPTQTEMKEAA
jgi:hypothetical protein